MVKTKKCLYCNQPVYEKLYAHTKCIIKFENIKKYVRRANRRIKQCRSN